MTATTRGLPYRQLDVFSERPLSGNGLAVFWQSEGLTDEVMLALTQEMRQFESIFLSRGSAPSDFRARIFTMEEELDFAGHPILGAAAVLHEQFGDSAVHDWTLLLNTKAVPVRSERRGEGYRATMDQGKPDFGASLTAAESAPFWEALGLSPKDAAPGFPLAIVSTGLPYLIVPVAQGLERAGIIRKDFEALLATVGAKFVYVLDIQQHEGRTWDNDGRVEDIATGSAAGPVGAYLWKHGALDGGAYLVLHQGRFVARPSRLEVQVLAEDGKILSVSVTGGVSMVATGKLD